MSEVDKLTKLIDDFSYEMKKKLYQKYILGYRGWDSLVYKEGIRQSIIDHAKRGDGQEIDIANLAAMLWNLNRSKNT